MYFSTKSYLKSNHYHNVKHILESLYNREQYYTRRSTIVRFDFGFDFQIIASSYEHSILILFF
jgi:hypothetical protein